MSLPRPVPSKAALNALRGLVFTTSCSVVLLAEERRQRTKIARAAVDNARKLHTVKARRNSVPLVDARAPDADFHVVDLENMPRPRKRRKESSADRSQSAGPRSNGHTRLSGSPGRHGTMELRPSDWQLDAGEEDQPRTALPTRLATGLIDRGLSDASSRTSTASSARAVDTRVGTLHQQLRAGAMANPTGKQGDNETDLDTDFAAESTKQPLYSQIDEALTTPQEFASLPDFSWSSPEWGSQEDMTAYYDGEVEELDPSAIEWGLPILRRPRHALEGETLLGDERLPPPKSYGELWLSVKPSKKNQHRHSQLYRRLCEMQAEVGDTSQEHADILIRAKMYLLYSPGDEQGRTEFFQRLSSPGYMVRSFAGAKHSARKLIEDLWRAAKNTKPGDKMASHYLSLAIDVLRSFPAVEQRLPATSMHPAGFPVIKRLVQLAMERDEKALGAILTTVLRNADDVPGFMAKLFQFFHDRDDGPESIQRLLVYFKSQPPQRFRFTCDQAFLKAVLQRHGRLLRKPQRTQELYSVVREATLSAMIPLSKETEFDIHLMLLEGAMVQNIHPMVSSELSSLADIDPNRFMDDSFIRDATILHRVLHSNYEDLSSAVEKLNDLQTADSEVFSAALDHVMKMCQQRLPPGRFLKLVQELSQRHTLPFEDEWAQVGLEYYMSTERPDFYALHSWLQFCAEHGWSAPENVTGYTNWRLSLYGDVDPDSSIVENTMNVAEQCARRDARRQEIVSELTIANAERQSTAPPRPTSMEKATATLRSMQQCWRDINRTESFHAWEKGWLMDVARARFRDDFGSLDRHKFDTMWTYLTRAKPQATWDVFAANYKSRYAPIPVLRLAVMARLRLDRNNPSIAEQLVDEVYARGLNIDDLLQPLLMAQIDRRQADKPGPTSVINQALRLGHKVPDEVYNYAAREAFKRANPTGAIAICYMAAEHNGNGNPIYNVQNLSNLMRGYVSVVALRQLASLLQMVVNQDPPYIHTRLFRDTFRNTLKMMATRAVVKEEKRQQAQAARCRELLQLLVTVRSQLGYHVKSRSQLDAQPLSDELIDDLAENSLRHTWLPSPEVPTIIDEKLHETSFINHEPSAMALETEEGCPSDPAVDAAMSWGLGEVALPMAGENQMDTEAVPAPTTSVTTDGVQSESISESALKWQYPNTATPIGSRPSEEQRATSDEFGRRATNAGPLRPAARFAVKPRAPKRPLLRWDEPKQLPTMFDKIAAARRVDRPEQAESSW